MKKLSIFILFCAVIISSCKKQVDDVQVNIILENLSNKTSLGRNYSIDETRFYLSNFKLTDNNGNEQKIKDIYLVKSGANNSFTFKISSGSFTKFIYSFGLDKTTNNSNPNDFEDANPLSTKQDMYWAMLKYRFIVTEAKIDSSTTKDKTPTQPFSMHLGSDTLYKVIETSLLNKPITKGSVITIKIDMNKIFALDAEPFNITNFSNHSEGSDIPKAIIIIDSLVSGIGTDLFIPN